MSDYPNGPGDTLAAARLRDCYARGLPVDHPERIAAHAARMAEVLGLGEEYANPQTGLWWLSFVDPARSAPREEQVPGGGGFLGVIITEAFGFMAAVSRVTTLGINPGGEVKGDGPFPLGYATPEWRDRLLSWEEVQDFYLVEPE